MIAGRSDGEAAATAAQRDAVQLPREQVELGLVLGDLGDAIASRSKRTASLIGARMIRSDSQTLTGFGVLTSPRDSSVSGTWGTQSCELLTQYAIPPLTKAALNSDA